MKEALITAVGTVLAAIIGYFAYKQKGFRRKYGKRMLKYHPVHYIMDDYKEYINYGINAENIGRERLIKDFLLHLIEIYRVKFKYLSNQVDSNKFTDEELKELNLRVLHEAINERSTYFYTDEYTAKERLALNLLVKKYQNSISARIEYFKADINKVIDSKYYNDQITMQALILDKYIGELSHILTWFEDVIDDINGDFYGLNFKGDSLNKGI